MRNVRNRSPLGVCPVDDDHQVTQISASREGFREWCCQCREWRWKVDLRPIRQELREMGVDPDKGVLAEGCQGEC